MKCIHHWPPRFSMIPWGAGAFVKHVGSGKGHWANGHYMAAMPILSRFSEWPWDSNFLGLTPWRVLVPRSRMGLGIFFSFFFFFLNSPGTNMAQAVLGCWYSWIEKYNYRSWCVQGSRSQQILPHPSRSGSWKIHTVGEFMVELLKTLRKTGVETTVLEWIYDMHLFKIQ